MTFEYVNKHEIAK